MQNSGGGIVQRAELILDPSLNNQDWTRTTVLDSSFTKDKNRNNHIAEKNHGWIIVKVDNVPHPARIYCMLGSSTILSCVWLLKTAFNVFAWFSPLV